MLFAILAPVVARKKLGGRSGEEEADIGHKVSYIFTYCGNTT
jgi:hypothetical protein